MGVPNHHMVAKSDCSLPFRLSLCKLIGSLEFLNARNEAQLVIVVFFGVLQAHSTTVITFTLREMCQFPLGFVFSCKFLAVYLSVANNATIEALSLEMLVRIILGFERRTLL